MEDINVEIVQVPVETLWAIDIEVLVSAAIYCGRYKNNNRKRQ